MSPSVTYGTEVNFETSTESPNNGANQTQFDMWAIQVVSNLYLYYTPLLVCLGCIGNMVSVFVFYNSKLRLQSTSLYLSALAISDTIFLLQLLPPWLSSTQITQLFHTGGFCQFFIYVSYVTCCLSAWLVVAFTVERFVAVLYPLRRNAMCTLTRARHVIISIAITSIVMNLPVLRFALPTAIECNIDRQYLAHAARFNLVDTVLSFSVPLGSIILLNSSIIVGVCRLERDRHQLMKNEQPGAGQSARCTRRRQCPRSQHRVTRMLLIVSSVFVVLNLPAYTVRILAYAYDLNSEEVGGRWTALQQLSDMFFHTNFGINFILYCLSGQNFRRALMQAMPCFIRRARRAVVFRRGTSNPDRANSISSLSAVSFGSNYTEATSAAVNTTVVSNPHRRPERFITRWKFDNSRQERGQAGVSTSRASRASLRATEHVEMRAFGI